MDKNFLTNKLGPLPYWGWMGIAVVGLILFTSYKKKTPSATTGTGTAGLAGTSAANLPNGTAFDPQGLTVVQEGYNPPTNNITVNTRDANTSSTPFASYIRDSTSGQIYGVDGKGMETALSPEVWAAQGNPVFSTVTAVVPHGISNPSPISRPTTNTTALPSTPTPRSVTVAPWSGGGSQPWNSTLWGIAQHYYNDGSMFTKLAQANGIANPNLIYPGQKIVVP